jgi:phytoene dehydrogenase-like protein
MNIEQDAIIVGSGPNGLAAAITLAQQGWKVQVIEARDTVGGGTRTAELTLPGFRHDICSAIHPLGLGSPFFRSVDLSTYDLEWIQPDLPLAHPFEDGTALALHRSLERTRQEMGRDGAAYGRLMEPLVRNWDAIAQEFLGPLRLPRHPWTMLQFGLRALWPAKTTVKALFREEKSRAFFAGLAAHAMMPLEWPTTTAFGLMLAALAHVVGWPLPRGGSQAIANALAAYLLDLGGEIITGHEVKSIKELPPARAILLDVTPRQVVQLAGDQLPSRYRRQLEKYRYGPGVFKIDWALSEPIPWRAEACRRAGTVHIGASLAEICASEQLVWQGLHSRHPYTLVTQQSLFDETRAPNGQHTGWAYCHVPHGSKEDMTAVLEGQIERFAPGFRDCILARHTMTSHDFQRYNPNYIGGDINGGVQNWRQLFTRPVARFDPYSTPLSNLFLCSSATPPGGGVHGMCGYHAAQSVIRRSDA